MKTNSSSEEFRLFIKKKREEKKLSISKLSEKVGISNSYLSHIETGRKGIPSPTVIRKLSIYLEVDYYELMQLAGYSDEDKIEALLTKKETEQIDIELLPFSIKKYLLDISYLYGEEEIKEDITQFIKGFSKEYTPSIQTYRQLIDSEVVDNLSIPSQQALLRFLWLRIQSLKRRKNVSSGFDVSTGLHIINKNELNQNYTQPTSRVKRHLQKKIINIPIVNNISAFFSEIDFLSNNSNSIINFDYKVMDSSHNSENYFIYHVEDNFSYELFNIKSGYKILFKIQDSFSTNGLYVAYLKEEKAYYIVKLFLQMDNTYICIFGNKEISPITSSKGNIKVLGKAIQVKYEL